MVSEAQREVLDTRISVGDHEDLKARLKAKEEQNRLLRLQLESARPAEVPSHGRSTRLSTSMMSNAASVSATAEAKESAQSVLRVASEAVQQWDGATWPEPLEILPASGCFYRWLLPNSCVCVV